MNEDEERKHCRLVCHLVHSAEIGDDVDIVMRERAAARAEQAQVPCVQHFDAIETLKAKLAWFYEREPLVRQLVGAVEDHTVFSDALHSEWRAVVEWEMDHSRGGK